ncbi:MAG: glycerol-3-phosphate dehydrogenase/oxidase [Planctomycetes bacterium]|nr:glycerol-3-phosphate dehydrogenase/oxidase [Planctomycetota bacterium]
MANSTPPILILGAGINGASLARELVLNGSPVVLVDSADVCYGATAYSSRLIHGGLRYLEYGDFALVRESLAERARLLRLAPQFVHPLHIHIPVSKRSGGWFSGARNFLGGRAGGKPSQRGLWLVRTGLWLYDLFAHDPTLPRRTVRRVGHDAGPQVDPTRYRWLCGYWDAQIRFPERYVQALLADARQLAQEAGVEFRVVTYHRVRQQGRFVELLPEGCLGQMECGPRQSGAALHLPRAPVNLPQAPGDSPAPESLEVAAIVNATGAWVDLTLRELGIENRPLMGGTKGSHFITFHQRLREALGDQALYAEADDGRPVFILPFGDSVLVGTTDIPFTGRPEDALASGEELEYLIAAVNEIMPQVGLTRADLELHYCGVRPLPASDAATPASVTRRHQMVEHASEPVPLFSVVGGKLTTSRQLAEEATATILTSLGKTASRNSRDRAVPGGEEYPATPCVLAAMQQQLAAEFGLGLVQVEAAWPLFGTRLRAVLAESSRLLQEGEAPNANLANTPLLRRLVRWIVLNESPHTLDDLIERRLMLLYHHPLTMACLRELADTLGATGVVTVEQAESQLAATVQRLHKHFGKQVSP